MSKLSSEGQALVHAVRGVLRPSDADRERVFYALRASLENGVAGALCAKYLYEAPATKSENAA